MFGSPHSCAFGLWVPWAHWKQVGWPCFAADMSLLADPCSSELTAGVPQDQSSAHLFPLHSGQFWPTAPAPTGRNWCSQTGEKHVVNPCTHPSWSKEEGEGCASGVCLCGCRVRQLFISATVWVPVVSRSPQKGHKLTFSSGNAPFREEQLCHHSNTCEPPVLFLVVSCVLCE